MEAGESLGQQSLAKMVATPGHSSMPRICSTMMVLWLLLATDNHDHVQARRIHDHRPPRVQTRGPGDTMIRLSVGHDKLLWDVKGDLHGSIWVRRACRQGICSSGDCLCPVPDPASPPKAGTQQAADMDSAAQTVKHSSAIWQDEIWNQQCLCL